MKKYLLIGGLLATLALTPALTCTPSQQTTTYNTLSSVETTVNGAYNSYLALVVTGKVPTNSVPAVSRDYNIFQMVFASTVAVAAQGTNSPSTAQVSAAASQVLTDITTATNTPTLK